MRTASIPANTILQADVLAALRQLPDESIDCVVTSPPYWALRDYRIQPTIWGAKKNCTHTFSKHPSKLAHENRQNLDGGTIGNSAYRTQLHGFGNATGGFCCRCNAWKGCLGLEPEHNLYIEHLVTVFDEIKRVLKTTGSLWVNLGDSYSSARSAPNSTLYSPQRIAGRVGVQRPPVKAMKPKCLCAIPERFVLAMLGRGWILRNEIIWHKPNCMPSSAKDRFTIDFDKIFFFVKSTKYWFDADAVKEPASSNTLVPKASSKGRKTKENSEQIRVSGSGWADAMIPYRPAYRNRRCVWRIPTKPFPDLHFAVYPEALCEIPIKAGCPSQVCRRCGTPQVTRHIAANRNAFNIRVRDTKTGKIKWVDRRASTLELRKYDEKKYVSPGKEQTIFRCACKKGFLPGIVLDPFAGSGTTLLVAKRLNRRYLGIEIKPAYVKLANKRLGRAEEKCK